jgi:predicted acylesterase/phospholipase RssA
LEAEQKVVEDLRKRADAFLCGSQLKFALADALWKDLKRKDLITVARKILDRIHEPNSLIDAIPAANRKQLAMQRAMLTSKDQELGVSFRHDQGVAVLNEVFDLASSEHDGKPELLGIAGGIYKRRWQDLGQHIDLQTAADYYSRAAGADLGTDAYAHINAAFLEDLLANTGDNKEARRSKANALRQRIASELPKANDWFNRASRVEALFGLRRFDDATTVLAETSERPVLWELQTTARQLAELAGLMNLSAEEKVKVEAFFEALWPGGGDAAFSMCIGKVGLALSGGGFRAAFYHLGLLAKLAEHDMLRHVDVMSCVSGGSIVGASYWLSLRKRLIDSKPMMQADYIALVQALIQQFTDAVGENLRGGTQPGITSIFYNVLRKGQKGALDPENTAAFLDDHFYRPLMASRAGSRIMMHELSFTPSDHGAIVPKDQAFNPRLHNWLRAHKVPALVLNATCVNTGHAWQFTPTWMGESPWAIHDDVDSVPRLEWSMYAPEANWTIELGRAVAASAAVPGIFEPLRLGGHYEEGIEVQLLDGGVFDNQGAVSLLAMNCNVLIISDACGQLMLEKAPTEGVLSLGGYAVRAMNTLMERIRGASLADLNARTLSGQLRRLMFVHMKAGLDADVIPRVFSQETRSSNRTALSPSGIRKDFQKAIAELRTDLDVFTEAERFALMACGYQMAGHAIERDLAGQEQFVAARISVNWCFEGMLGEITSTAQNTLRRTQLLNDLQEGAKIRFGGRAG